MATNPTTRKGGKSRKHVQGPDGLTIYGLSLHRKSGRYYAIGQDGRRVYFGRDLSEAIFRFGRWQEQQNPDGQTRFDITVPTSIPLAQIPRPPASWDEYRRIISTPESERTDADKTLLSEWAEYERRVGELADRDRDGKITLDTVGWSWIWAEVRKTMLDDLDEFCQRVGLKVKILDRPVDVITFGQLWDMYEASSRVSKARKDEGKKLWQGFQDVLAVNSLDLVSADKIRAYRDGLLASKHSPGYVQKMFRQVKAVLNNAAKEGVSNDDLTRVIGWCHMLRLADTSSVNGCDPHPIEPDDFRALLNVATDPLDRAILLVALNASYYPIDITRLPVAALNLNKGYIRFDRQKTGGTTRVCCLWKETVEAIRAYQKAYPHTAKTLFVSRQGKTLNKVTLFYRFLSLKNKAGISDEVKFCHLRDGCTSAQSAKIPGELIDVQLGHKLPGQRDRYVRRELSQVKPVADAMHQFYFGEPVSVTTEPTQPG